MATVPMVKHETSQQVTYTECCVKLILRKQVPFKVIIEMTAPCPKAGPQQVNHTDLLTTWLLAVAAIDARGTIMQPNPLT